MRVLCGCGRAARTEDGLVCSSWLLSAHLLGEILRDVGGVTPRVGGGCAPRAGLELVGERRGACEYRGRGGISALASDNLRDWAEAGGLERPPPREHKHGTIVGFADGHSRAPARVIKSWGALEEPPKNSHERRRRRRGRVARNVALSDEARRLLSPFVVSYQRVWLMRVN